MLFYKKISQSSLKNDAFQITEISTDKNYGYTQENPIKVGFTNSNEGPTNERRFLNALSGPERQKISYERISSCCQFKTKNGMMGTGLLDVYEIKWKDQKDPVKLYLNMYNPGELKIPVGFTAKEKTT